MAKRHLIGLLLATEEDWPAAFESVLSRIGSISYGGETHVFSTERITNEPFDLRSVPRYSLVIDRLTWWYDVPREWPTPLDVCADRYAGRAGRDPGFGRTFMRRETSRVSFPDVSVFVSGDR